jgi:hypothetical protein
MRRDKEKKGTAREGSGPIFMGSIGRTMLSITVNVFMYGMVVRSSSCNKLL